MDYIGVQCQNGTVVRYEVHTPIIIFTIVALGLIDLTVVLGNSLVIAAVITTRKLRTVTNIFIVSLATADLLLGFAVLPFSISVEVLKFWLWGPIWCNMWLAIDVWLCTASILSLCAISLDRYIAVTHPIRYPSIVSPFRGKILVSIVWILAFVICLPPLIGWNDTNTGTLDNISSSEFSPSANKTDLFTIIDSSLVKQKVHVNTTPDELQTNVHFRNYSSKIYQTRPCDLDIPTCELTPTKGYRIYAAMGSFFIPMLVLIFFYFRIYLAARKTVASLRRGVLTTKSRSSHEFAHQNGSNEDAIQLRVHRGGSTTSTQYSYSKGSSSRKLNENTKESPVTPRFQCNNSRSSTSRSSDESVAHENVEQKRSCSGHDASAQKGLLILFGSFGKRIKMIHKKRDRSHKNCCTSTEMEVLNPKPTVKTNDKSHPCQGQRNGVYQGLLRDKGKRMSPRRCKLIIKDTKVSVNAKGHARKFRRETKAAKTLAIIVGAFIICWLPFFTIYLLGAFCHDCVSDIVFSVFFWLGYCNSALNPCIYAMFARDFRLAFKQLLSCSRTKGFNHATRADYVTGVKKTLAPPPVENDSASDH